MNVSFLDLINLSITTSWIVLAVILLRFLLKKAPKWITCLLWGIVGLRLIMPFSIESALSLIPSTQTIDPNPPYISRPNIQSGITFLDQSVNDYLGSHYFEGVSVPADSFANAMMVFFTVWLIGIAAMLIYSLVAYLRLRRTVAASLLLRENIFLCDAIASPFVLGIFRPRIYLPSGMDEAQIPYVIRHETAHLHRKDHWWKPLGFLLLSIHWFNPVLWVAYLLLCRDIELACDEKAIGDLDRDAKKGYSEALLSCSLQRRMILACPLAFGEVGVKDRVKSVLNYRKPAFWLIVTALILCTVAAICLLTDPKTEESDDSPLNYQNAIAVAESATENFTAIHYPKVEKNSTEFSILVGEVTGSDLAHYLRRVNWYECSAPFDILSSSGSVEFALEEDYRITVYARKGWALRVYAEVRSGDTTRYYRISGGDYDEAVAILRAPDSSVSNVGGAGAPSGTVQFRATVLEVGAFHLLVEPWAGERERNSADRISVGLAKLSVLLAAELKPGDSVRIVYDGVIRESYPAQISNTYAVYPLLETPESKPPLSSAMNRYEVSWANYASGKEADPLFYGSLNSNKMYINHMQHLPIRKFESLAELEAFRKQFADVLTMDKGYNEIPSFESVISNYYAEENASYWEYNTLFLVYVPASSSTWRYGVHSIYNDGETLQFRIARTDTNETGDCAMAGWFITVNMSKEAVASCSEFDAFFYEE